MSRLIAGSTLLGASSLMNEQTFPSMVCANAVYPGLDFHDLHHRVAKQQYEAWLA
jgi:hypothetical protein